MASSGHDNRHRNIFRNINTCKYKNSQRERYHNNWSSLWNLSMSSEVDKMGFFTATFLPNKVASYTTLSVPIITISLNNQIRDELKELQKISRRRKVTSGNWREESVRGRWEMERDRFACAATSYAPVWLHNL